MRIVLFAAALAVGTSFAAQAQSNELASIGDSISRGYNATSLNVLQQYGDEDPYSFSTGTYNPPNSIYMRLAGVTAKTTVALDGSEMAMCASGVTRNADGSCPSYDANKSGPGQAAKICALTTRPDHLVIELGGNDICSHTLSTIVSTSGYQIALQKTLATLDSGLATGTRVLVLSMPRVDFLYAAGTSTGTYTGAKACSSAWIFGICDVVTQSNSATRTQVGQIVDSFNTALGSVVAAAPQTYAHIAVGSDWEGTISAGYANTSIGTYAFTRDDINGGDCFHPNASYGQCKLGCIGYNAWEGTSRSYCFNPPPKSGRGYGQPPCNQ